MNIKNMKSLTMDELQEIKYSCDHNYYDFPFYDSPEEIERSKALEEIDRRQFVLNQMFNGWDVISPYKPEARYHTIFANPYYYSKIALENIKDDLNPEELEFVELKITDPRSNEMKKQAEEDLVLQEYNNYLKILEVFSKLGITIDDAKKIHEENEENNDY